MSKFNSSLICSPEEVILGRERSVRVVLSHSAFRQFNMMNNCEPAQILEDLTQHLLCSLHSVLSVKHLQYFYTGSAIAC